MIRTKQGHERVRHSVYWKPESKELLERKSEELNMSQNYLTEICLQSSLLHQLIYPFSSNFILDNIETPL